MVWKKTVPQPKNCISERVGRDARIGPDSFQCCGVFHAVYSKSDKGWAGCNPHFSFLLMVSQELNKGVSYVETYSSHNFPPVEAFGE